MDPSKQKEIASKGGRAAHAKGTAHEFTSDEARVAGRKGGEAVSRDRAHMAAIGREGGHSRGARARAAAGSATSTGTAAAIGAAVGIAAGVAGATIAQRHHANESSGMDVSQGNGSQQFVRQPNDERVGYEGSSANRADRSASSREDRNDSSSDSGPLSNRDRI